MKFFTSLLSFTLLTSILFAQTSPLDPVCTFNYQAVARDANDDIIANQDMKVRFTILDGPGANELYIEEHDATSSNLGLFNLEVGEGEMVGGILAFEAIPWMIRKHFLRVELDIEKDGNFIIAGEAPILAVPIAIQAKTASIAMTTIDTIKRIDTLRVDTLKVKKIFAKALCVDSIIGKVVIDSIVTDSIGLCGDFTMKEGSITMKDRNGEIIFAIDTFGNSYHAGFETFAGGLEVLDLLGQNIFEIDPIFGILIQDDVVIQGGELIVKNARGEIMFGVDTSGNSYHAGFETFAGGLEILNADTTPFITIDPLLGKTAFIEGDFAFINGNLEMYDKDLNLLFSVDTLGNSYHAGFETFAGGVEVLDIFGNPIVTFDPVADLFFGASTVTNGDVLINNGKFEMVNANNELIFAVDENGNSYHKGLETFEGGIVLTNPENNETVVFLDATADGLPGYAFTLNGNFMLNGLLQAEAKNFVIDHPLNPDEMTLRHYSVESDQMGTVYNGTIEFDNNGEAIVELPEWFEALNTDFSYQLTCIGGFANVYISEEVQNNRFKIGGGKKGMKVSWQVNGVRHDAVSSRHKKPIEEYKPLKQ